MWPTDKWLEQYLPSSISEQVRVCKCWCVCISPVLFRSNLWPVCSVSPLKVISQHRPLSWLRAGQLVFNSYVPSAKQSSQNTSFISHGQGSNHPPPACQDFQFLTTTLPGRGLFPLECPHGEWPPYMYVLPQARTTVYINHYFNPISYETIMKSLVHITITIMCVSWGGGIPFSEHFTIFKFANISETLRLVYKFHNEIFFLHYIVRPSRYHFHHYIGCINY